jgi:O-antigen/teichoic acid export membrane protein
VRAERIWTSVAPWRQRLSERLQSAVTRGVLWTTGGYGVSQVLRLATNLVVTRLLNPEAFGLMAIVDALLIGAQMVSDTGIVQALVQRKDAPDRNLLNTAWAIHALRGLVLFVVLALLARPIASWYGEPALIGLLTVGATSLVLEGLWSTGKFVATREMALKRLVLFELVVQLSGIAFMLACAWIYRSVWALVAGSLVSSAVGLLLSHWMFPRRGARLAWTRGYTQELVRFGRWLLPSTVLLFVILRSDRLLIGKAMSVGELGAYNIACFVPLFVVAVVGQVSHNVLFPLFSRLGENGRSQLRLEIERRRATFLLLAVPLLSLVAVYGDWLVVALYDQRYHDAGWMLRVLACGAVFASANENALPMLLALGDPYRRFLTLACSAVLFVAAILLGGAFFGGPGLVAGVAVAPALAYPVVSWSLGRHGVWTARVDLLAFSVAAATIVVLTLLRHGFAVVPR